MTTSIILLACIRDIFAERQSSFKDDLDNRGVLLELLSEVDKGKIKNLYVWNTDRLSRNQKVWGLIRYKLTQNNVKLFVGSDVVTNTTKNLRI